MKKVFFLSMFLFLSMIFDPEFSIADMAETMPEGQEVYKSIGILETQKMRLAGIDLSLFGYSQIYQYAFVKQEILFILGEIQKRQLELSSIRIDNRTYSLIAKFPTISAKDDVNIKFTVFTMHKLKDFSPFIAVERMFKAKKTLQVFSSNRKKQFVSLSKTEISFDSEIFLCDANEDGYTDILIWGSIGAQHSQNKKALNAMIFDNTKKAFSEMELLSDLIEMRWYGFLEY